MKEKRVVQILITVIALAFIITHLIWPTIKIDAITITLVIVAIIPWLAPLFKSIELPGGLKFEFQELRQIEKSARRVGLIKTNQNTEVTKKDYSFLAIADQDSNLALAGLRIEIEKRIKQIAKDSQIEPKRRGIIHLLRKLGEVNILNFEERAVIADMLVVLNKASHGETYDERVANWVIDIGPKILDSLDTKSGFKN